MIFFSNKIRFKKESESLGLNLKDKQIKANKLQLQQLNQQHAEVHQSLKKHQSEFSLKKNQLLTQHQLLIEQQKKRKLKLLKLSIRKDQLLSKQNPSIKIHKASILKKYLQSVVYTVGDRYQIIKSLGNFAIYDFIKTKLLHLQHKIYLKNKMKQVVFMKKIKFEGDYLMLLVKELQVSSTGQFGSSKDTQVNNNNNNNINSSNINNSRPKTIKSITNPSKFNPSTLQFIKTHKSFQVRIYAITGKKFDYSKVYSQRQFQHFIDKLSNKKKPFDSHHVVDSSTVNKQIRKPRLSLEFNPVFKKSLQGFFFKRSSLTASRIENKMPDLHQWMKEDQQQQRSPKDSENSVTEHLQSSQQNSEINSTVISKSSQVQSQNLSSHFNSNSKHSSLGTEKYAQNNKNSSGVTSEMSDNYSKLKKKQIINFRNENTNSNQNNILNEQGNQIIHNNQQISSGFIRPFLPGEKILFPDQNPLLNIVILKSKNNFEFLPQYLEKKQNLQIIMLCVKKYQLKIKLQKQIRRSLLYKIIRIQNCFESENKEMEPFKLDVLFTIKYAKNDIYIPKTSQLKQSIKMGRTFQVNQKLKGKPRNIIESFSKQYKTFNNEDIVLTCQNIKCEADERSFLINHLLRQQQTSADLNTKFFNVINNSGTVNNRIKGRSQNLQNKKKQQQNNKQKDQKQKQKQKEQVKKLRRKKVTKENLYEDKLSKQDEERKQSLFREDIQNMFECFLQQHLLSIKEYCFKRKIDYLAHLNKIVTIQKNLKCYYYKSLFKKKSRLPLVFKFEPNTKILITAILDTKNQQIKIFTECLVLKLNNKYKSYPLVFPDKYWSTIGTSLNSLGRLSNSIVEVKDELTRYLQKKISLYQQQQAKLQALRPQLYLNRLRRFFINIMLRVKAQQNILYLKKIYSNSQTYVLIIRRSHLLKTVCQANLYHLQQFYQKQQQKYNNNNINKDIIIETQKEMLALQQNIRSKKTLTQVKTRKKVKYQTINLLIDYFERIPKQKIADEFYFDNEHFLLKPQTDSTVYYIERLAKVDINSEQIAKQIAMIEWHDPSKKKRLGENSNGQYNNNLQELSQNKILHSFHSKSQNINLKLGEINTNNNGSQENKLKLRRKNASIIIEGESDHKLNLPSDKVTKQRGSFRISERNKCVFLKQEHNKPHGRQSELSHNNKRQNTFIGQQQQQSISKLNSYNRLSRNSLYDIFNNSVNKKAQYEIRGNGHGKYIYYSLAKVQQVFFQLKIYMVKRRYLVINRNPNKLYGKQHELNRKNNMILGQKVRYNCQQQQQVEQQHQYIRKNAFSDELLLIHQQNINKKQLLEANSSLFYNRIAHWIKKNEQLLILVDQNSLKI